MKVEVEGIGTLEFPDGTSKDVIAETVRKKQMDSVGGGGFIGSMSPELPEPGKVGEALVQEAPAVGGLVGTGLALASGAGTIPTIIALLAGAAGGESFKQTFQVMSGSEAAPKNNWESWTRIRDAVAVEGYGELAGLGLGKLASVGVRRLQPKMTGAANRAKQYFKDRIPSVTLLPSEMADSPGLTTIQNIIESSYTGGGTFAKFRSNRTEAMNEFADGLIDEFGSRTSPTELGELYLDVLNKKKGFHSGVSEVLYNGVKEYVERNGGKRLEPIYDTAVRQRVYHGRKGHLREASRHGDLGVHFTEDLPTASDLASGEHLIREFGAKKAGPPPVGIVHGANIEPNKYLELPDLTNWTEGEVRALLKERGIEIGQKPFHGKWEVLDPYKLEFDDDEYTWIIKATGEEIEPGHFATDQAGHIIDHMGERVVPVKPFSGSKSTEGPEAIWEALDAAGYDGVRYVNQFEGPEGSWSYIMSPEKALDGSVARRAGEGMTSEVFEQGAPVLVPSASLKKFAGPLQKVGEELDNLGRANAGDDLVDTVMGYGDELTLEAALALRSRLRARIDEFNVLNKKAPAIGVAKKMIGLLDEAIESSLGKMRGVDMPGAGPRPLDSDLQATSATGRAYEMAAKSTDKAADMKWLDMKRLEMEGLSAGHLEQGNFQEAMDVDMEGQMYREAWEALDGQAQHADGLAKAKELLGRGEDVSGIVRSKYSTEEADDILLAFDKMSKDPKSVESSLKGLGEMYGPETRNLWLKFKGKSPVGPFKDAWTPAVNYRGKTYTGRNHGEAYQAWMDANPGRKDAPVEGWSKGDKRFEAGGSDVNMERMGTKEKVWSDKDKRFYYPDKWESTAGVAKADPRTVGQQAVDRWRTANTFYREGQESFNNTMLRRLVKKARDEGTGPSTLAPAIFKPGNVDVVKRVFRSADENTRKHLRGFFMEHLLQKSTDTGGIIQGRKLINNLVGKPNSFGDPMLHEILSPSQVADLKAFGEALDLTQQKGSGSGSMLIQFTQAGMVGAMFMGEMNTAAATTLIAPAVLAKIMTKPWGQRLVTDAVLKSGDPTKFTGAMARLIAAAARIRKEEYNEEE